MSFVHFFSSDVFKPHSENGNMRANTPSMEIMTIWKNQENKKKPKPHDTHMHF